VLISIKVYIEHNLDWFNTIRFLVTYLKENEFFSKESYPFKVS